MIYIIGGGFTGTSLALGLLQNPSIRQSSKKIILIEKKSREAWLNLNQVYYQDYRAIVLNPQNYAFLKNLKLSSWRDSDWLPVSEIQVSGVRVLGQVHFKASTQNTPLGWVIQAGKLLQILRDQCVLLEQQDKLVLQLGQDFNRNQEDLKFQAENITHDWIGADGTDSKFRYWANMPAHQVDFQQCAYLATIEVQEIKKINTGYIAYLRWIPRLNKTLACIPMGSSHYKLILIQSNREFVVDFLELFENIKYWLPSDLKFVKVLPESMSSEIQSRYDLMGLKTCLFAKKNKFLVGNAAQTLHPIAAQGLNLGFWQVEKLIELLIQKTSDVNLNIAENYQKHCVQKVEPTWKGCEVLSRLGSNLSVLGLPIVGLWPAWTEMIKTWGLGDAEKIV